MNLHIKNELKNKMLQNSDDLIKDTFCYSLFEEGFFHANLIEIIIKNVEEYISLVKNDIDIKNLLIWICQCVDQCFISHHDKDDYYTIKNYSSEIESKWINGWKARIQLLVEKL
ncbi:hypothetical protein A9G24_06615 [Gilliamella sp. App6-5]|uniref:hypothetical protein n=1 Tax=Gilliamella sp. App6-5 TaxID=3120232 RepID=UPI00080DD218|nr:hypothetical protein [Gilliamella apicola]OCG14224.1 hypothetical protein A9G24_06615 [Gilliamella apicola]